MIAFPGWKSPNVRNLANSN